MCEWGIVLYVKVASNIAKGHMFAGRRECCRNHTEESDMVSNLGLYGIVVDCMVPDDDIKIDSGLVLYYGALSVWNCATGRPCCVLILLMVFGMIIERCARDESGMILRIESDCR